MKSLLHTMRPPRALAALAAVCAFAPAAAAEELDYFPQWPVALQTDVLEIARGFKGEFALYVKDLAGGARYTFNAATPMYLASGIKIPVLVALFRDVEEGRVALTDEMVYGPEDVRDGSPLLARLRLGTPISVQALAEAMIQQSDNAATDMVIKLVGVERVNRILVEEGYFGFGPITSLIDVRLLAYERLDPRTVGRLSPHQVMQLGITRPVELRVNKLAEMMGVPASTYTSGGYDKAFRKYYAAGYNAAPVEAMGQLLEGLARGRVITSTRSREMMDVLLGTQTGARRLRGGLPRDTPLAHKTGTQYQRTCDFGVFFMSDDRPVVIAVAVKGGKSRAAAENVIAKLASRTYWHLATPEERDRLGRPQEPVAAEDDDPGVDDHDPPDHGLATPRPKKKILPDGPRARPQPRGTVRQEPADPTDLEEDLLRGPQPRPKGKRASSPPTKGRSKSKKRAAPEAE